MTNEWPNRIHFICYPASGVGGKCYCGESYKTFTGRYNDSVWGIGVFRAGSGFPQKEWEPDFCKECMANPDLALDVLKLLCNEE